MVMDVAPLIVIVTPVLMPVVKAAGMSEITFGIMLIWPAMFAVLFLITYVPWFTEFLPNMFMK